VLRDAEGDVLIVEDAPEIQCERCGRWSTACAPIGARWVCFDRECHDAERYAGS